MTNETKDLLEKANEALDVASKNVRIVISDLRDDKAEQIPLQTILNKIDKAKQELEELLYPAVSDVEMFRFTTGEKSVVFSSANH